MKPKAKGVFVSLIIEEIKSDLNYLNNNAKISYLNAISEGLYKLKLEVLKGLSDEDLE